MTKILALTHPSPVFGPAQLVSRWVYAASCANLTSFSVWSALAGNFQPLHYSK
jgi:hypothetical protein